MHTDLKAQFITKARNKRSTKGEKYLCVLKISSLSEKKDCLFFVLLNFRVFVIKN